MRPYIPGEDMTFISLALGEMPEAGGMIAINPIDDSDQWYISKRFFEENYELALPE